LEISDWQTLASIAINEMELDMHTAEFEELAGRIDALSHAVLVVAAELELMELIDGPRLTQAWRSTRMGTGSTDLRRETAHGVLGQLADLLDGARANRSPR
jgi:hypothetical protein